MKKQQAILFDLDGTLLNTLDDLTSSVNVTLQAHGFPLRRKTIPICRWMALPWWERWKAPGIFQSSRSKAPRETEKFR